MGQRVSPPSMDRGGTAASITWPDNEALNLFRVLLRVLRDVDEGKTADWLFSLLQKYVLLC